MVHLGSVEKGYEKTIKFSVLLPYSFGPASLGIKNDWKSLQRDLYTHQIN